MKKFIILIIILMISSILLSQTILYVNDDNTSGPWNGSINYPYQDIQDAIDNASDTYIIKVFPGSYSAVDFLELDIDLEGQGSPLPEIDGDTSSIVVDMTNIDSGSPSLIGFKVVGSSTATGVKLSGFSGPSAGAEISGNVIDGVGKGVHVGDNIRRINTNDNEFLNNTTAYYSEETSTNFGFADYFNYNVVHDNDTGLFLGDLSDTSSIGCLFYKNDLSIDLTDNYGHAYAYLDLYQSTITNSSSINTDTGIFVSDYSTLDVVNSIIYGIDTQIDDDGGTISITYSDIEDGYTGTGNIDEDPLFCKSTVYAYHLLEGSPCIDTGDPTTTGGDVNIDMGCYETTTDIKECEDNSWNWVSYPRLNRTNNDSVDVVPLLEEFLDWDFELDMFYDASIGLDPTLEYTDFSNEWDPEEYDVCSSLGYKLNPRDTGVHYLPTVSNASRLDDDWELTYTLLEDYDCWMGYWLPYILNIEDAFGEFFDDLVSVSAEDWYYEWSKDDSPSSDTANKNMVYGKGYVVVFETDIDDFYWTDATSRGIRDPGNPRPEPQYFTFDDLPSYEAIDVMEIPSNVFEIGVFEDDVCVGAVVVQNEDEQILAYTDGSNRSQVPLTFEVVTNNRGENLVVSDYRVLNKETGKYENRSLISGQQKSSIVLFGELEEHQNNTPSLDQVTLHGNYPNPFNPTTNISFSLPEEQNVELIVYNLRGQTVRKLAQGQFIAGVHSVTWDSKDGNGKSVGSGLYLYKLITRDKEISKKMLLLK